MNTFESIFTESHKDTERLSRKRENVAKKNSNRLTESKRRKLTEDLFDDVSDIRREMGIDSAEETNFKTGIGKKVADMLNARINNEMKIDNPGFKATQVYQDDDYVTVEVEDGDGYIENGSARFENDETALIKAIVDNILANLEDGEYCGTIKEEADSDEEKLDDFEYTDEGYIADPEHEGAQFDEIEDDNLYDCDLMTVEEFLEHQDEIPAIDMEWWLQDAAEGETKNVQYVNENNELVKTGKGIYDYLGVRPVVSGEFEVGQEFSFMDYDFIAFTEDKAICAGVIGTMDFDPVSNIYRRSLLREFLHDWAGGFDISEYEETDDDDEGEILDRNDYDGDDGEFIVEANDDWKFGYSLWK